jgi:hypothetical protein
MTLPELEPKLIKYRRKGLLLDTNLLLLYLVGRLAPDYVEKFKPTQNHGFKVADFELLARIVQYFRLIVTTPHVLTEVSNHSVKLKGDRHAALRTIMAAQIESWTEQFEPAVKLCAREDFRRFGLTDSAISATAPGKFLVITVDFALAGYLASIGADVVNFNQLRPLTWANLP